MANWNDENTAQLTALADAVGGEVSQADLDNMVAELGDVTKRSVGAKLRKMGYEVQKASDVKASTWSEEDTQALNDFVVDNTGSFTYAEIAAQFNDGSFSTKQVQGKILSLELTEHVKPTPKAETVSTKTYSDEEEAQFIALANEGKGIEAIAQALGRTVPQARGKALSLLQQERISAIPATEVKTAKASTDIFEGLNVAEMTVAELVEATEKTERGIKSTLSRRGVDCADYKGAAKKAKADAKREG